jgi:hypothetical protein
MTALGLLWGFLPIFHVHAFLIVSLMMLAIAFEHSRLRDFFRLRSFWIAFVPALYFILHSTNFFRASAVAHWHWGWTLESQPLWGFLMLNFGPWLFVPPSLAIALWVTRASRTAGEQRRLWMEFGTYSFLWLLFFNLILAPWAWDNIKLLIWPYLGFARLLWVVVEPRLGRFAGALERPMLAGVLFLSGVIAVAWTLQAPTGRAVPIYSHATIASTKGALGDIPHDAVFAAAATFQHPLTYFGHSRAAGYAGHVWSHGIEGRKTYEAIDELMRGGIESADLAARLGVTHIFWGPDENAQYGVTGPPNFGPEFENISRVAGYSVFRLKREVE